MITEYKEWKSKNGMYMRYIVYENVKSYAIVYSQRKKVTDRWYWTLTIFDKKYEDYESGY